MVNHKEILRAQTSGTHKPGDRTCCWLRPQHGHTHISPCSGAAAWLGSKRSPCRSRKFPSGYFQPSKRTLSTRCRTTKWVHREMQKSGVTLSLLWVEYCEQCRQSGELPYKSTQFNKYYADYVHKTKATMHLEHKPGETMQVDWAGQTAALVDTDTGERLDAYLFVAVAAIQRLRLHTEAFLDMKQEAWITGHVNAYRYFGGVTRILTPDNLKTGVLKNSRTETVLNKSYQEMAEHYGTAILPARPRSPKDKAFCGGLRWPGLHLDPGCSAQPPIPVPRGTESGHSREGWMPLTTSSSRNGRAAERPVLRKRSCFCCRFPATPFVELAVWKVATGPI